MHKLDYDGKQKIFFSSDFHFNHKNIVKGISSWESGTRDFNTQEEHDQTLIDNINKVVGENDILYFLGDFAFGSFKEEDEFSVTKNIQRFRNKINCKQIHFIIGNHDEPIYNNFYLPNSEDKVSTLFSSVNRILDLRITVRRPNEKKRKVSLVLSHYPMRSWDLMYQNSIMLYGHTHNTLDNARPDFANPSWMGDRYFVINQKTMDVGVDAHPEFRPFELTEILEKMDKIETKLEFLDTE